MKGMNVVKCILHNLSDIQAKSDGELRHLIGDYGLGAPHNPNRVRAEEIPTGYRLMSIYEVRLEQCTCLMWATHLQKFHNLRPRKPQSPHTYAVKNTEDVDPLTLVKPLTIQEREWVIDRLTNPNFPAPRT